MPRAARDWPPGRTRPPLRLDMLGSCFLRLSGLRPLFLVLLYSSSSPRLAVPPDRVKALVPFLPRAVSGYGTHPPLICLCSFGAAGTDPRSDNSPRLLSLALRRFDNIAFIHNLPPPCFLPSRLLPTETPATAERPFSPSYLPQHTALLGSGASTDMLGSGSP